MVQSHSSLYVRHDVQDSDSFEPQVAEDTDMARGVYAEFFQKNKEGLTHVDYLTRTYYISRQWTLRGPIPPGVKIEHVGLANTRREHRTKKRPYGR